MFTNLRELILSMPDEKTCRDYVAKQRWPDGKPVCPHCGHDKAYVIEGGKKYKCAAKDCYKKFSVTVGTIMEASNIPVSKWLTAIYLVTAHKKGISSYQLGKDLGIAQKNSWFMLHRIREALRIKQDEKLNNVVEIDETYIGGKVGNMSKSKRTKLREDGNVMHTKRMVIGMLERNGYLKLTPMSNNIMNIQSSIQTNIEKEAVLITDSHPAYAAMKNKYAAHHTVNHSAYEYVREGDIHTNSIEGAFSQLKRSIYGIYHQVTPKHLSRYCDETAYRYNLRKMKDADRFTLTIGNLTGRLTYKNLINAPVPDTGSKNSGIPTEIGTQGKSRAIIQLFDGEIIKQYNSTKEASLLTGIGKTVISKALRGIQSTAGGYQWIYA